MPIQIADGGAVAGALKVETAQKALRATIVPRGAGYALSAPTGTIGAALGALSSVFVMRLDPGAAVAAFIYRFRITYTTIVAYTTPVTAGRRLALYRGSGAAASGGTALATIAAKDTTSASSEVAAANGGDARIATTGALTVAGITYETDPLRTLSLVNVGAAGGSVEGIWDPTDTDSPLILQPGQLLAVRNPVAMDAAGTWQIVVNVDWSEAAAYAA